MSHHKTRKSNSRSRHNKTKGGAKGLGRRTPSYKEKRRGHSTTSGAKYNPPKKVSPNAKKYYDIVMPKKEWNALSIHQQREAQKYVTTGPNNNNK